MSVEKLKRVLRSYSGNCKNVRLIVNKNTIKPVFFESGENVTGVVESILLPLREFKDEE